MFSSIYAIAKIKGNFMNDVDFVRLTAMLILPNLINVSTTPINDAVDYAEELLRECQKRENM